MESSFVSLLWIALCAVIAPLLAGLVPRKLVPEVVILLIAGVLIGPFGFRLATTDDAIGILRELGLGMLFLLAGYEIEISELTGRSGRRALVVWLICLGIALAVVSLIGLTGLIHAETALAIALCSTALGTLLPILKDGGLLGSKVGRAVMNHGAFGELGPIIAMAVLLGTAGPAEAVVAVIMFALIAGAVTLPWRRIRRETSQIMGLIRAGSETTGQTTVRLTVLLLVGLSVLAEVFELDVVLGAFAAGFILRQALPRGDEQLETKLNGLAFGLLIPIFFVTSGMAIDPRAVAAAPLALVLFVGMIMIVRGLPVFASSKLERELGTGRSMFDTRESARIGLFAATGLPIIVAVTSTAVSAGQMTSANASVLVAGGAVTVLLMPLAATLLGNRGGVRPVRAES
ncbi:MAG TPA: cation:proton antiporter [Microlunatus sp.]|nr:cation:proton antiporter [Microlunatus sp.]